jgi:hypothetical protein
VLSKEYNKSLKLRGWLDAAKQVHSRVLDDPFIRKILTAEYSTNLQNF